MKSRSWVMTSVPVLMMILALAACSANGPETTAAPTRDFSFLQKRYFLMLDFRGGNAHVKKISAFAAELNGFAEKERAKLAGRRVTRERDRQRAGLVFIYDALLTHNNTTAVLEGKLLLADLKVARQFSAENLSTITPVEKADQTEIKARAAYVVAELTQAKTLRSQDRRIDSWLTAAKAMVERLDEGHVSEKTLENVLKTIPVRPTFNLWTALLIFKDIDSASPLDERLLSVAKTFVDHVNAGKDPCKERPQDCGNGPLAPYHSQGALSSLGDLFLRRAEWQLEKGDLRKAMQMASYAKDTYSQLDRPALAVSTQAWPDNASLTARHERLAKIQHAERPSKDFFASDAYRRVYECASCHGRVQ